MRFVFILITVVIFLCWITMSLSNTIPSPAGTSISRPEDNAEIERSFTGDEDHPVILSARIVGKFNKVPMLGDLWFSTWAADDNLYMSWGDGTGLGYCYPAVVNDPYADSCLVIESCDPPEPIVFCEDFCGVFDCDGITCYPPCTLTAAGLFQLEGPVNEFEGCEEDCHRSIHIPTGIPLFEYGVDPETRRNDKPSSLLYYNGLLYWSGHEPSGEALRGYIAYSEDFGSTWTESPNSPWTENSNFRVLMFINMGRDYELNEDGFVYGLGIGEELHDPPQSQQVYLARVPKENIGVYSDYSYFTGLDGQGNPQWSYDQYESAPLDNLETIATGAAMYHPGIDRYLFLALPDGNSGPTLTLYEAPDPWGPWFKAQVFEGHLFIPGIIPRDTGPASFYFTAAGGSISYQLNIGKIEMRIRSVGTAVPVEKP